MLGKIGKGTSKQRGSARYTVQVILRMLAPRGTRYAIPPLLYRARNARPVQSAVEPPAYRLPEMASLWLQGTWMVCDKSPSPYAEGWAWPGRPIGVGEERRVEMTGQDNISRESLHCLLLASMCMHLFLLHVRVLAFRGLLGRILDVLALWPTDVYDESPKRGSRRSWT